jgi:hypothetical protein
MERSLHHLIRERAYELWNANGRLDGLAEQHWLAAEREILQEMTAEIPSTISSLSSRRESRPRTKIGPQRRKAQP